MAKIVLGIVIQENKILLIKRKKADKSLVWAFPGGKIEAEETPKDAVIREIMEETGVRAHVLKHLGSRSHPQTNKEISYFLCNCVFQINRMAEDEVAEIKWCGKNEVLSLLSTDIFPPVKKLIDLL